MMGNSSPLNLAIIYIDLSLFIRQLFSFIFFSFQIVFLPLFGRKAPAEVKARTLCSLLIWRLFWKTNEYDLPCGMHMLSETAVKIEVGKMQLPDDTISYRGHNCFALREDKALSSA